jgi:phosphate transporter
LTDRRGTQGGDIEEYELVTLEKKAQPQQPQPPTREQLRQLKRNEKRRWLDTQDEMKFSHSIQFNAVPDWSSHYIAYSNLKKMYIYSGLRCCGIAGLC